MLAVYFDGTYSRKSYTAIISFPSFNVSTSENCLSFDLLVSEARSVSLMSKSTYGTSQLLWQFPHNISNIVMRQIWHRVQVTIPRSGSETFLELHVVHVGWVKGLAATIDNVVLDVVACKQIGKCDFYVHLVKKKGKSCDTWNGCQ